MITKVSPDEWLVDAVLIQGLYAPALAGLQQGHWLYHCTEDGPFRPEDSAPLAIAPDDEQACNHIKHLTKHLRSNLEDFFQNRTM